MDFGLSKWPAKQEGRPAMPSSYTSLGKGKWRVKKEGVRTDHGFHWNAKAYTAKQAWDMLLQHVNYGK